MGISRFTAAVSADQQDRPSMLGQIASNFGGAASLHSSAPFTRNDADGDADRHPSICDTSCHKAEETIDLSTVLAQARHPFFVVDHQYSANGSIFRTSPTSMDDQISNSIELSTVIDASRNQSDGPICMVENDASTTRRSLLGVT
jgi:hypothetical protein